jgi:hypothetical protein
MQWIWAFVSALTAAVWFDANHLGLIPTRELDQVAIPTCLEHTEAASVSINSEYAQSIEGDGEIRSTNSDNKEAKEDPLSTVASAIWKSLELQNHAAIFSTEQFFSCIGVSMMSRKTISLGDNLLTNTSVRAISGRLADEFANAFGVAVSMLPPDVQAKHQTISAQVKQLWLEYQVEYRWRRMSEQMQVQATKFLAAFQARFPHYRLSDGHPLRVLAFLAAWYTITLYISCRALFLLLSGLRKMLWAVFAFIQGIFCCPCRACRRCMCAQKRNRTLTDGSSHNLSKLDGKQQKLPDERTKAATPSSGGA